MHKIISLDKGIKKSYGTSRELNATIAEQLKEIREKKHEDYLKRMPVEVKRNNHGDRKVCNLPGKWDKESIENYLFRIKFDIKIGEELINKVNILDNYIFKLGFRLCGVVELYLEDSLINSVLDAYEGLHPSSNSKEIEALFASEDRSVVVQTLRYKIAEYSIEKHTGTINKIKKYRNKLPPWYRPSGSLAALIFSIDPNQVLEKIESNAKKTENGELSIPVDYSRYLAKYLNFPIRVVKLDKEINDTFYDTNGTSIQWSELKNEPGSFSYVCVVELTKDYFAYCYRPKNYLVEPPDSQPQDVDFQEITVLEPQDSAEVKMWEEILKVHYLDHRTFIKQLKKAGDLYVENNDCYKLGLTIMYLTRVFNQGRATDRVKGVLNKVRNDFLEKLRDYDEGLVESVINCIEKKSSHEQERSVIEALLSQLDFEEKIKIKIRNKLFFKKTTN